MLCCARAVGLTASAAELTGCAGSAAGVSGPADPSARRCQARRRAKRTVGLGDSQGGEVNRRITTAALLLAAGLAAQAGPRSAPAPSAQIEEIARRAERECVNAASTHGVQDEVMRMLIEWQGDPAVCKCQGDLIRRELTTEFLSKSERERRRLFFDLVMTRGAECELPVFKERFAASCGRFVSASLRKISEPVLREKLARLAFPSKDAYVWSTCSCLRPAVRRITTKEWMDGSLAVYQAYVGRKRGADLDAALPKGAFGKALDACLGLEPVQ